MWLWFCSQDLRFPLHSNTLENIRWVVPTYTKVHQVLTNPFYAGVYVYGKTHQQRYIDDSGRVRKRSKKRSRREWPVFIRDHHPGYINWATFEANQKRLGQNIRPRPHQAGGAVREGSALPQGLAACGSCGRRLKVHYKGRSSTAGYHCAGKTIVNGRGEYCLNHASTQTTEMYLRADTTTLLQVMNTTTPPTLRKGHFRPPDQLIALLRTQ